MDKRVIILGVAVAFGAVVLLLGAFMLLSPGATTSSSLGKNRPAVAAASTVDDDAPRIRPGSRVRVPNDPALQIVDVPPGATVDDGGLAFSDSLCKKATECGCERRAPRSCATAWGFVKKEQTADVKCLFDLACEDLCMLYQHPRSKDNACVSAMGKLESAHIMGK